MSIRSIIRAGLLCQLALPALGVVHEQLASVPSGWTKVEDAHASTPISLKIALQYQNLDQLESELIAVSTPGNPEYGKHLDLEDLNALFPPADDKPVISWLKEAGISHIHSTGSIVNFATTVGAANELLNASFAYYSSENGGSRYKLRTTQYSIPDHLVGDIELITPTTYFGKSGTPRAITSIARRDQAVSISKTVHTAITNTSVAPSCQKSITPACLKQMYSVGNYTPDPESGSWIGFGSFLNQSALFSDLFVYEKQNGIPFQNFSIELINGGTDNQNVSTAQTGEADLDVQNIVGVSHPLPVVEYITGGSPYVCLDLNSLLLLGIY